MRRITILFLLMFAFVVPAWGGTYGEIKPSSDVVALWHFNGDANDSAGSNDGTVTDATSTTSGKFGGAYSFDGSSDNILMGGAFNVGNQTTWTILAWIKTSSTGNQDYLFRHDSLSGGTYILCRRKDYDSVLQCETRINYGTMVTIEGSQAINDGVWHLMTFVKSSASSHALYVDGDIETESTVNVGTVDHNGTNLYIGAEKNASVVGWIGQIDEVAIWDRALSADEIRALYNMQKGAYGIIE